MGNAAIAEELPSGDELDVLYRLGASESGPEDEDEDGDDLDEDEDEDGEEMHRRRYAAGLSLQAGASSARRLSPRASHRHGAVA